MITPNDTIGYISRRTGEDGKEQYEYIEAKIKSVRIGKRGTKVYSDKFRPLDAEDIKFNTEWFKDSPSLILVQEPFSQTRSLPSGVERMSHTGTSMAQKASGMTL